MAVEYACVSSSSTLTDTSSVKETKICKHHGSQKRYREPCYYVCLGVLTHMVHKQIQKDYPENHRFYLTGRKYINNLYKWIRRYKHEELFVKDFLKSLITSIALFAIGIKLTDELVAWKVL